MQHLPLLVLYEEHHKLKYTARANSLRSKKWFRHLCTLYKIKATGLSSCVNYMLPKATHHYQTQNLEDLVPYQTRTNISKYSSPSIPLWNGTNVTLTLEIQLT